MEVSMVRHYSLLATIFCKWLKWHIPERGASWTLGKKVYSVCMLCGAMFDREKP
jgi:hypothetical protein